MKSMSTTTTLLAQRVSAVSFVAQALVQWH
jgi:hypothetical protein